MRRLATGAASCGAPALMTFTAPVAHADTVVGDTQVSSVVVNGGKDIVVGTTNKVTFKVTFTASDPSGISSGQTYLYHGTWSDPDALWTQDSDSGTNAHRGPRSPARRRTPSSPSTTCTTTPS